MALARSLPDSATEWWDFLGAVALYVFTRWVLTWHQARRDGDRHPVRAAFGDEDRLRVTLLCTIGPVLVAGVAYVDFRYARRSHNARRPRGARA
ncbi:hypothetical protein K4B79_25355 [Streptomyces lincolnensis]|uniref:hypothetical protein n=1 Tax=Streptomyces lincolnensis TaxID=1915 RepID=UPI001E2B77E6|nr:hypothetical protein [Streptomyces lincolnensis]MCD7441537.1 hypothetical protein [Streptomyces lincolnensis]